MKIKNLLIPALLLFLSCTEQAKNPVTPPSQVVSSTVAEKMEVDERGYSKIKAVIKTAHGDIVFQFFPNEAPRTVSQIKDLIQKGFYNGLTFHRVVPNFVVQGGDPMGTGEGGSGKNIPAEFNQRKHIKGTVAMARSSDPDSADSQFYIALDNLPHLDNQYTIFGQVTEGMDVLSKINQGDKMLSVQILSP